MSDFKVGDEVWYIGDHSPMRGSHYFSANTMSIENAIIVRLDVTHYFDNVLAFFDGSRAVMIDSLYKSKQECIDAFKKRLDEL